MDSLRQIRMAAMGNFDRWGRSPQVWLAFGLGFVACFLLSGKALDFAQQQGTLLQLFEPFIWTFGDANSILLISLCLLLLPTSQIVFCLSFTLCDFRFCRLLLFCTFCLPILLRHLIRKRICPRLLSTG